MFSLCRLLLYLVVAVCLPHLRSRSHAATFPASAILELRANLERREKTTLRLWGIHKELRLVVTLKQLLGPVAQILIQAGVHVKPFGLYKGGCALCGVLQCQNMLSKKQMQEPKRRPSRDSRSQESANPSRTESNRQLQGWAHGGARWSRKKLRAAKQQQIRWRRWGLLRRAVSRQLRATPAVPSYHARRCCRDCRHRPLTRGHDATLHAEDEQLQFGPNMDFRFSMLPVVSF